MARFKWNKKGIASLLVLFLILHTVFGFSSPGTSSSPLMPSKSRKYKRSARKVRGEGDFRRVWVPDHNKKRSEFDTSLMDNPWPYLAGIPQEPGPLVQKYRKQSPNPGKWAGRASGSVEDRVKKITSEQLGKEEGRIKMDSHIKEDLGADSLDEVELVMALEEEFDIEISDEDCDQIKTVGGYVEYVNSHLSGRSGGPSHRRPSRPSLKLRAAGLKIPQAKRLGNLGAGKITIRPGYSRPTPVLARYQRP